MFCDMCMHIYHIIPYNELSKLTTVYNIIYSLCLNWSIVFCTWLQWRTWRQWGCTVTVTLTPWSTRGQIIER